MFSFITELFNDEYFENYILSEATFVPSQVNETSEYFDGIHLKLPTDFLAKSTREIDGFNYSFSHQIVWDFTGFYNFL